MIIDYLVTNRENSETYYRYTDLNRVNEAIDYLQKALAKEGYYALVATKNDWAITDFPTVSAMTQYLDSLVSLHKNFLGNDNKLLNMLPSTMAFIDYANANDIEESLKMSYNYIENMKLHYRECNGFESGEV